MALRERIISLNKTTWDYVEARRIASERGMKLPSNVLHDEYLRSGDWEQVGGIYPAWAREILVHPRLGRKFIKGRDVLDSSEDRLGRKWVLPGIYVRKAHEKGEVYGIPDMGLLVEAGDIEEKNWRVIVHPASITILRNVVCLNATGGMMNSTTGLPQKIPTGLRVAPGLKRRLFRNEGAGVRPIIRCVFGLYADARYDIHTSDAWPFLYPGQLEDPLAQRPGGIGVSGVVLEEMQLTATHRYGRLIVEGTPEMLEATLLMIESLKSK